MGRTKPSEGAGGPASLTGDKAAGRLGVRLQAHASPSFSTAHSAWPWMWGGHSRLWCLLAWPLVSPAVARLPEGWMELLAAASPLGRGLGGNPQYGAPLPVEWGSRVPLQALLSQRRRSAGEEGMGR